MHSIIYDSLLILLIRIINKNNREPYRRRIRNIRAQDT